MSYRITRNHALIKVGRYERESLLAFEQIMGAYTVRTRLQRGFVIKALVMLSFANEQGDKNPPFGEMESRNSDFTYWNKKDSDEAQGYIKNSSKAGTDCFLLFCVVQSEAKHLT